MHSEIAYFLSASSGENAFGNYVCNLVIELQIQRLIFESAKKNNAPLFRASVASVEISYFNFSKREIATVALLLRNDDLLFL